MGEGPDLLTTPDAPIRPISHRRIGLLMAGLVLVGMIFGGFLGSGRFAVGILIGGLLSFANFVWLDRSTRAIFDNAARGIRPGLLAARYILRYVVLGAVLWLVYRTDVVPVVAVIAGLASFAVAVVIDGVTGIFKRTTSKVS